MAWLAAVPLLTGAPAQLFSAHIGAGHVRWRRRMIVAGAVVHALVRLQVALPGLCRLRVLRSVRRLSGCGLIFRFTRPYPPAGMALDLLASFRKGRKSTAAMLRG